MTFALTRRPVQEEEFPQRQELTRPCFSDWTTNQAMLVDFQKPWLPIAPSARKQIESNGDQMTTLFSPPPLPVLLLPSFFLNLLPTMDEIDQLDLSPPTLAHPRSEAVKLQNHRPNHRAARGALEFLRLETSQPSPALLFFQPQCKEERAKAWSQNIVETPQYFDRD